jgi:hypothetical protein
LSPIANFVFPLRRNIVHYENRITLLMELPFTPAFLTLHAL